MRFVRSNTEDTPSLSLEEAHSCEKLGTVRQVQATGLKCPVLSRQ